MYEYVDATTMLEKLNDKYIGYGIGCNTLV